MENAQAMEIARAWPDGWVKPRNRLKIVIEYIWFRLGDALNAPSLSRKSGVNTLTVVPGENS